MQEGGRTEAEDVVVRVCFTSGEVQREHVSKALRSEAVEASLHEL